MLRAFIYAILALFVISIIRMLAGALTKGASELFRDESASTKNPPTAGGGPLKRDPVCGTYIPADASVRKSVNGEVLYFCSPECRDKYVASA